MQKIEPISDFDRITPTAAISLKTHGFRAKCLQRLVRLDLPVPVTVALPATTVRAIAAGHPVDCPAILADFGPTPLVSVRPSPENPDWGGPATVLNIGMNAARHAALARIHGEEAADAIYLGFIQSYAIHVARLDPEMFETGGSSSEALRAALHAWAEEMDEPFPQDPAQQLSEVLRSMARAWEGTTARLLRQAKGAPAEARLGLVVQEMAQDLGQGISGSGVIQFVDPATGVPQVTGRFFNRSRAWHGKAETLYLTVGTERV